MSGEPVELLAAVTVDRVIDGDTVRLRTRQYAILSTLAGQASVTIDETVTVRLLGIQAPELRDPEGPSARATLESLLTGPIKLLTDGRRDKYGRLLADLRTPTCESVADKMLSLGAATVAPWKGEDDE